MGVEINEEENPLDRIKAGEVLEVPKGQLVMRSPIVIKDGGKIIIRDGGHLILEE